MRIVGGVAAYLVFSIVGVAQGQHAPAEPRDRFSVAIATYSSLHTALDAQARLSSPEPLFVVPVEVSGEAYYRLVSGMLPTREDAEDLMGRLIRSGAKEDVAEAERYWHIRNTSRVYRLAASSEAQYARNKVAELSDVGIPAYVVSPAEEGGHRVYAGGFADAEEGRHLGEILRTAGYTSELGWATAGVKAHVAPAVLGVSFAADPMPMTPDVDKRGLAEAKGISDEKVAMAEGEAVSDSDRWGGEGQESEQAAPTDTISTPFAELLAAGRDFLTSDRSPLIARPPVARGLEFCTPPPSDDDRAPRGALELLVGVRSLSDGVRRVGTGIIVGETSGQLLVATAEHVVKDAGRAANQVQVHFLADCKENEAIRLNEADVCEGDVPGDLDLAVLCVPLPSGEGWRPTEFARRGSLSRLGGAVVYPVGCPGGQCWAVGREDQVLRLDQNQAALLFTTFFVSSGHSGGALFNEDFEIVGLVTEEGQPLSEAIPIDTVMATIASYCAGGPPPGEGGGDVSRRCEEGSIRLANSRIPRRPYPLTVGASLIGTSDAAFPDGRLPGGRLTVVYQPARWAELHAGAIRLTPTNLSITSTLFGVGLVFKRGPLVVNPFVEGGIGRVEGRYDAGGYELNGVTVPFWQQVQQDGLGFGVGSTVQLIVAPPFSLELTAGHWRFSRPENAPSMPSVFFGLGARIGT